MKFFGIPANEGALGKNNGCEEAPAFLSKLFRVNIEALSLPKNDFAEQQEALFCKASKLFLHQEEEKFVFFGGTHDITFSLFKAFKQKHKRGKLLIFDAHADSDEGLSTVSHEDFVRALIDFKIAKPQDVCVVGLRKVYNSEKSFVKKSGITFISASDVHKNFPRVCAFVEEFASDSAGLFVSFDVDVLSSSLMKATGYSPSGGLSFKETKTLLDLALPTADALDIAEFNPKKISLKEDLLLKNLFGKYFS